MLLSAKPYERTLRLVQSILALSLAPSAAAHDFATTLALTSAPIRTQIKGPDMQITSPPPHQSHAETAIPEPVAVPSPTLQGVAPISSGLKVADYMAPAWGHGGIPGQEEGGIEGAFRFLCAPSHNAYDDPIVSPGQSGKSHLHTFFGNTKAGAHSTYRSLRTSGDSTCNNALNRSAYWIAAMMHPTGKVVMPDYLSVYYKRISANNPGCKVAALACVGLPRGLRYIFGFNMKDPLRSDPAHMKWWNCDGVGAKGGHFATLREAAAGCPKGARLGAIVVAPNCWNGTELDSADHRSHMAWPRQNGLGAATCPSSHPYLIPQFQLQAWYMNDGTAMDWRLASDDMLGMPAAEAGTTLHADWFGAWEDSTLALWERHCLDGLLSCSGGDLGNGRQIKTNKGYEQVHGRPMLPIPAR